ncbi:MAG: ERG2 family protein [Candidatus Heimdallarchaeota archaeon]
MRKKKRTRFLDKKKHCIFDPRKLWDIAKRGIGHPKKEAFDIIIKALAEEYPGYIETKQNWVFNFAGGAMGQMTVLHGSFREYLIIFGTNIGSNGHSGRYKAEVFDFIFTGEMLCEYTGHFKKEVHKPGSVAYLPPSIVKHYCIKEEAWMLEYARGNIISMLPFGFADSIISALDHITVLKTIKLYGKQVVKNLFKKGKDIDILIKWLLIIGILIWFIFYGIPMIFNFFT